jgi:hypothetical protein
LALTIGSSLLILVALELLKPFWRTRREVPPALANSSAH